MTERDPKEDGSEELDGAKTEEKGDSEEISEGESDELDTEAELDRLRFKYRGFTIEELKKQVAEISNSNMLNVANTVLDRVDELTKEVKQLRKQLAKLEKWNIKIERWRERVDKKLKKA